MSRTLFVTPTADHADDLISSAAGGPVAGRVAMTVSRLEETLLQPAMRGLRRLPSGGRRLALNALLHEADKLLFLQSAQGGQGAAHRPGFARAVEAFLLDLSSGGVGAKDLERAAAKVPDWLGGRVVDLARLAGSYDRLLADRGVGDPAVVLSRACADLSRAGPLPEAFRRFDRIEFRDIVDWPPGRVGLVRGLAGAGLRVGVELPRSEAPEVRDALEPALHALESSGADVELTTRPLATAGGAVQAFDAATLAEEVREVARRVAELAAGGVAVHDIAVAAVDMGDLAAPIEEALAARGLRARLHHGASLARTTLGRLAVDLARWDAPEESTRERVCAIAGCDAIDLRGLGKAGGGRGVSSLEIVRHLREAAIRSRAADRAGADGFASRLERLALSYEADERPVEAARVRRAARVVAALFARLDARPAEATLAQHGRALLGLLEELGAPRWLSRMRRRPRAEAVPPDRCEGLQDKALASEQAAWDRLRDAMRELESAAAMLGLGDRDVSRSAFAEWLANTLAAGRASHPVTRGAGVEVLDLSDLAGRRFRHVFIVGAHEGRLPGPPPSDVLFTEEERWLLNGALGRPVLRVSPGSAADSPLPSTALLDAAALALAAESAGESLTVSRARSDDRWRPLADSPLISIVCADPSAPRWEHLPYAPADPLLAARLSPSVEQRAAIALRRAAVERAEGDPDGWSGDVSAVAPLIRPLAAGRPPNHPWSASALERLANCGFRYLAEWAWRAREEDEPEDEAGAMEVGRIAHLAAEHAVQALIGGHRWSTADMDETLRVGMAAAERVVRDAERKTVLGHPELWELRRAHMLRRLRKLLEIEIRETTGEGLQPIAVELGFGLAGATLPAFEVAGTQVAGQIDRVDAGRTRLAVLDYKSGRTENSARKLADGALFELQLQLPIYVAAMHALLPEARGAEIDAAYVSLRDLKRTRSLREVTQGAPIEEIRRRVEEAVQGLVAQVDSGRFPVRPHSCRGCHLQPVCRVPRLEEVS